MASIEKGTNVNCTNSTAVVDQLKGYYLPVAYSVIFAVGLVGNVTAIYIYLTKLRPWNSSCVIMMNLALTDLLYVFTLPFIVYYYVSGDSWTLGDFMCRLIRFAFHFNLYGSIMFLTCLAVFRYAVVAQPLKAARVQQKRWAIAACAAVWVITTAEIAPMLAMITIKKCQDNVTKCLDLASTEPPRDIWRYGWVLNALGFLLPLVVVTACCVGVVKHLAKGPYKRSPGRVRVRRLMVVIMTVFVVCFLPFHVLRTLRVYTRMHKTPYLLEHGAEAAYIISRPLAALNIFFNLVLYTLAGGRFQGAFLSTFCCKRVMSKPSTTPNLAVVSNQKN